jgi:hypothetical protein
MLSLIESKTIPDGKCRIWQGPLSSGTPVMRVPGLRDVMAVRRLVLLELGPPRPNRFASATCGNPLCVSARCVKPMTRRQLQKTTAANNDFHKSPSRAAKIAISAKKRRRFDDATAASILTDHRSGRELARDMGVHQSVIQGIRAGKTYKDASINPWAGLFRL